MKVIHQQLTMAVVGAVCLTLGTEAAAESVAVNAEPLFSEIKNYEITIPANGDLADIYLPILSGSNNSEYSLPIALLLQGSNVDKSNYSNFANIVASYGFAVVVPNHPNDVFIPFGVPAGLFSEQRQVNDVLTYMKTENSNPNSPLFEVIDTSKMVLLGHSYGGFAGLYAIEGACVFPLCTDEYTRPPELMGGAFYGSALSQISLEGTTPVLNNDAEIPVLMLAGNVDGLTPINATKETFNQIQNSPKSFITINGANHYSITNTSNPIGSFPDLNQATLNQNIATETIARWSSLFLRANVLDDQNALNYIYDNGKFLDKNIAIFNQIKSVPEANLILGLLFFSGVCGFTHKMKFGQRN